MAELSVPEIRKLIAQVLAEKIHGREHYEEWSRWRRRKRQQARRGHYKTWRENYELL